MMNKIIKIGNIILVIVFALSLCLNVYQCTKHKNDEITIKTDTITKIDTLTDTIPVVTKDTFLYTKKVKVPVIQLEGKDTLTDTLYVEAEIPITQKEYAKDSLYNVWVSGYEPKLDSIRVYPKTTYIEKVITINQNRKRWGVGPSIIGGYDPTNRKFGMMIGVGVTYNLFNF